MTTTTQLVSHDGTPWPIWWDTTQNNIGIFQPAPRCTIEVANQHPGVQDTRLAIGNHRDDGSRGVMTISARPITSPLPLAVRAPAASAHASASAIAPPMPRSWSRGCRWAPVPTNAIGRP